MQGDEKMAQVAGAGKGASVGSAGGETQGLPVVNEIVWLMTQSPAHRHMFIGDLGGGALFPPYSLRQFRLIHSEGKPVAYICWALVTPEVLEHCKQAGPRLRPSEWRCGDIPLVVDVVAPFGGTEAVIRQLQEKQFAGRELMVFASGSRGEGGAGRCESEVFARL